MRRFDSRLSLHGRAPYDRPSVATHTVTAEAADTVSLDEAVEAALREALELAGARDGELLVPVRGRVCASRSDSTPILARGDARAQEILTSGQVPAFGGGGWTQLAITEEAGWPGE